MDPHLKFNLEKYEGYTKKYCVKKLSMSGYYQDADLIAMAKDYLKTEGITPAIKHPLKVFDGCMGCGGFGTILSRENIPTLFDGNDLSRYAVDWVAQNVKNANKLWDIDSSQGFNFIVNNTYDLTLAWFCLNNIARLSKDKKSAGCDMTKDLIRITRPGGLVWLGMYYERDCPGTGNDFPLDFFTGAKDGCKLEGTTIYQHHTLAKRYGFDRYCPSTMKSTWLRVD